MESDLTLTLHIMEDSTDTAVHAILNVRGDHFESIGKARRRSTDPSLPVIGEELAIARALQDLTAQVSESANTKIEDFLKADSLA